MRRSVVVTCVLALALCVSVTPLQTGVASPGYRGGAAPQAIQAPVLKWQHAGCYSSWCETGWYSSPAVADLDGDGKTEVIAGAYTVYLLNGEDGTVERSIDTQGSRVWPGIVVVDLDADGDLEIVTAQGGGYLNVLDHTGDVEWWRRSEGLQSELRGLSAYDLDGDGTLEIVVTAAVGSRVNTWVYEHDGAVRAGWPQLSNDSGYAWGVFNDNATIGDLDADGVAEIVVPSDVHYVCAYTADGAQIPAHAMYGGKGWGKVGVWESPAIELRGWGTCTSGDPREERYRANFAHGPAAIADVNGDGAVEVVAVGNVYDCVPGYPSRYNGVYLFNRDRSRFSDGVYDWADPPRDTGAPLSEDYGLIENAQPNPVIADLDGDGQQEILYASYDGRVHAFWLDKGEHGSWPYAVYTGGPYRFASEPVVADLDDDGHAEVLFASWVQKGSHATGKLHVLDYLGNPVHEVDLPVAYGSPDWNGALAAPTLDDIDGDPDLEVVLNTAHSGFVAYDLPGTANARVLWGTGRGNYQRTGSALRGSLYGSTKRATPSALRAGDVLTYTVTLRNPGPDLTSVHMTDTLPAEIASVETLWASSGSRGESGGVITWTGEVPAGSPVIVRYGVTIDAAIVDPRAIVNEVWMDDGSGEPIRRQATVIVNGYPFYLPLVASRK
jgi:uncharacterized repeat protein (TIGR01451 family)